MTTKRSKKHTPLTCVAGAALLAAAMLASAAPAVAGAAADKCQAGKNTAAGTYSNCLAKAEKAFVTKGDVARYDAAVLKCQARLQAAWEKLEATASAAGDPCPAEGDVVGVQELLDGCAGGVSEAASGGTPPQSPLVCRQRLQTCDEDLAACEAAPAGVPRTGQTTSYGPGSDGAEQRGTARSFTDNGDGTITDNVTGLMWEKKSDDGSIHDKDNVYSWGMDSAPFTMNGTMVTEFLAELNSGGGFAGYTDWRIPNRMELETLLNLENVDPASFPAFNNGCTDGCTVTTCSCTRSYNYLSSSTLPLPEPEFCWCVPWRFGDTQAELKTNLNSVRAVRGGS